MDRRSFAALGALSWTAAGASEKRSNPIAMRGPRLAVVDYSKIESEERRQHLARFDLAITSFWHTLPNAYRREAIGRIKALNPRLQVAQYTILSEYTPRADPEVAAALDQNNWWLRDSKGQHVQWTAEWGNWDVNVTRWAAPDASGRHWSRWKAEYDTRRLLEPVGMFDWVFADTVMDQRVTADWKRAGADQSHRDADISRAVRLGFVDHWTQLRVLNPGLRVMANAAPEYLASPEMRGQAEGAFLEGMMGKPYSLERQADGWNRMMARYRAAFRDTAAPHAVVFQIYSAPDDHRLMRYGLCSALLDDGYFAINAASLQQAMPWYDEYDAALGAAIDAPPTRPDASGLWLRRYRGGIVVVNPQPSALGIELPQGYRRLAGSISPDVNNGRPVSALTVQAKDGLILER